MLKLTGIAGEIISDGKTKGDFRHDPGGGVIRTIARKARP